MAAGVPISKPRGKAAGVDRAACYWALGSSLCCNPTPLTELLPQTLRIQSPLLDGLSEGSSLSKVVLVLPAAQPLASPPALPQPVPCPNWQLQPQLPVLGLELVPGRVSLCWETGW